MKRKALGGAVASVLVATSCVSMAGEAGGSTGAPRTAGEATTNALARTQRLIAAKQPVRVVAYGDSISEVGRSEQWHGGASAPQKNWAPQFGGMLTGAFPGSAFIVLNSGIGGQNTYEGLGRLDGLASLKPDLVLLAFGANDCCYHYLQPEESQQALAALVTEIRQRYGADVVVLGTGGDNPLKPFFLHLPETLAAQRKAAAEAGAPFVDIRAAVLAATTNGQGWAGFHLGPDNCHPNDAGHRVWAEAVFGVVAEALRVQDGQKTQASNPK
jgi:acyl-CoA thioesterase I